MTERDTKIKNMLVGLEKDIFTDAGKIRDVRLDGSDFLPNIMMYQCFKWILNKTDDELQQRKEEMKERILTAQLQKPEDMMRLMNDRCMLTALIMFLPEEKEK